MADRPAVLVLDDGELEDVGEILSELGISFGRMRGALAEGAEAPSELLLTTPRRVGAVMDSVTVLPVPERPMCVVIAGEDSTTLRSRLRKIGFDYLVRRPVHPDALRLLLLHCLYRGEEKRGAERVPVGLEVTFRTGLIPRRAILADLSMRGCRLLCTQALEPGTRVKIALPEEMGSGEELAVEGKVLRVHLDSRSTEEGLYSAAVLFDELAGPLRRGLDDIVRGHANGRIMVQVPAAKAVASPASPRHPVSERPAAESSQRAVPVDSNAPTSVKLPVEIGGEGEPATEGNGGAEPDSDVVEINRVGELIPEAVVAELDGSDRRKSRRSSYGREVPAFGDPLRVLVGRDLSIGGMRVERTNALQVGDRVHLALYGESAGDPVLVWATAVRDDRERGLALSFEALEAEDASRLERLVGGLPSVEPLQEGETGAMGAVISRILES